MKESHSLRVSGAACSPPGSARVAPGSADLALARGHAAGASSHRMRLSRQRAAGLFRSRRGRLPSSVRKTCHRGVIADAGLRVPSSLALCGPERCGFRRLTRPWWFFDAARPRRRLAPRQVDPCGRSPRDPRARRRRCVSVGKPRAGVGAPQRPRLSVGRAAPGGLRPFAALTTLYRRRLRRHVSAHISATLVQAVGQPDDEPAHGATRACDPGS